MAGWIVKQVDASVHRSIVFISQVILLARARSEIEAFAKVLVGEPKQSRSRGFRESSGLSSMVRALLS